MRTVVSFADGVGNYLKAMGRLEDSLRRVNFTGRFKGINDYGHINSPHHKGPNSIPYAFKALSIKKAIEEGATTVLWCDSVVYATKPIEPIFDYIEQKGYLLFDNLGFTIGDYTSDACLDKFGMTREEAFNSKMIMACVMGFDLRNPLAKAFLDQYINAALDGVSYHGDWTNELLQVSRDMRVKGTRHDQSVASIIAKQKQMEITHAQSTFFAYEAHKGFMDIAPTVSLLSGGI